MTLDQDETPLLHDDMPKPDSDEDVVIAALDEKEQRLLAELDRVRQVRAKHQARAWNETPSTSTEPHTAAPLSTTASATAIASTGDYFRGLGLAEAAMKHLSTCNRQPQTVRQIWAALHSAGFKILAEKPEATLSWQLRKREDKRGDVVLTGNGLWGLTEWYTPDLVQMYRANRNAASNRNHGEHVQRTAAGIANAKRRGLTWGRPFKITAQQMEKALAEVAAGKKLKHAALTANMSPNTLYHFAKIGILESWKPGMPWPPEELRNYNAKLKKQRSESDLANIEGANGNGRLN